MDQPVDLTNFRDLTDGDVELEQALFVEFMSSFESGITSLQQSCGPESAEAWKKSAHALKGIALNLGAAALGELCKKAQNESEVATAAKQEILRDISSEYGLVQAFLTKIMAA